MRILENASFNFIGHRSKAYVVSGVLIMLSLISLVFRGVEYGIDFRGGMEYVVETSEPLDATLVRAQLARELGVDPEVKRYDQANLLLVRTVVMDEERDVQDQISETQTQILNGVHAGFPGVTASVVRTDIVGPRFADDLRRGAIYSILGALLVIFVYILIRFEWRFGLGALAAIIHDVTIVLGIFSLLHGVVPFSMQIDQAIIAAFLTIVGYSLNDTVVVFDRIREYTNVFRSEPYGHVVNRSVNNTLSRTFVTSGTTLLVVLVLFIFGGEVLRGFAFALMLGIMVGTYSSIYVAAPVVVELRERALAAVRRS